MTARSAEVRRWLASLLLLAPFAWPFVAHFVRAPDDVSPSGFIQPDMPYYMGNAREHFDNAGFTLTYGLPYSPSYETPKLYFQPQTLVLGLVMKLTGLDPAALFLLFGIVSGLVCIRLAFALFERRFGLATPSHWLGAISFIWGGGLLVAAGLFTWRATGDLDQLFAFDPSGGLWFLNLGRNLLYPHEAYYHALWIGAAICLAARRYWPAFALFALLSASHPFTGVHLLGIAVAWGIAERFLFRNRDVPITFVAATTALLLLHLGYYRLFLARSLEHRIVELQWTVSSQSWTLSAAEAILGYAIVGAFACWTLRSRERLATVFADPFARFLAAWTLASIALENNELFLRPNIQPLHFTRGYTWMALFLLGAPALIALFQRVLSHRGRMVRATALAAIGVVLFADNAVFLATFQARKQTANIQMWLPAGFRELARFLSEPAQGGTLVLTPFRREEHFNDLTYLVTVYTPLRTWLSHPFNTPAAQDHREDVLKLFEEGTFLPAWENRKLLVVLPSQAAMPEWASARGGREVFRGREWSVTRIEPSALKPVP